MCLELRVPGPLCQGLLIPIPRPLQEAKEVDTCSALLLQTGKLRLRAVNLECASTWQSQDLDSGLFDLNAHAPHWSGPLLLNVWRRALQAEKLSVTPLLLDL